MSIIEVNHVTKEYRLGHMNSLKQSVLSAMDRLRGRPSAKQEPFKALDDIDFKVEEGEVLGIIGTNGAGKSTLLKLLARVNVPTKGGIEVRGSVAPLIEVGAGQISKNGRCKMLAINGVYDKGKIELIKEVSIKGKRRVIVTFLDEPFAEIDLGLKIDPIRDLKGCAKGLNLTEKLLESRREDLNLEESKWGR